MAKSRFNLILATLLCWTTSSHAEFEQQSVYLSLDGFQVVHQGAMECGLTAIFNSFLLGKSQLRDAILQLPGSSIEEKYKYAKTTFAEKPSEYYGGTRARLSATWGMAEPDIRAVAMDLINSPEDFVPDEAKPLAGETPRAYAIRIHEQIFRSLKAGVPPVIVITGYENETILNMGHAMVIIGVSELTKDNSFTIELMDSLQVLKLEMKPHTIPSLAMAAIARGMDYSADGTTKSFEQKLELSFMMGRFH